MNKVNSFLIQHWFLIKPERGRGKGVKWEERVILEIIRTNKKRRGGGNKEEEEEEQAESSLELGMKEKAQKKNCEKEEKKKRKR